MMMTSVTYDHQNTVELSIGGMTGACCADQVQRKLNKLEGVTATVDLATEKAKVTFPEGLDPHQLIAQVEETGYTAALAASTSTATATSSEYGDDRSH
ncbi:cation transporter [Nonomuraea sp. KM90]|uniref:cation transporter n=1 Tax=Nonomuraea sp. KM90 TaxID=3457428 RepID=UPI003FCD6CF7